MLVNEAVAIQRGDRTIHFCGIDDAHYFRTDNIEKAAAEIPPGECSILLSHTPEVYRQAAHAGFKLMLSGHTHGGQICLPGGVPIIRGGVMPRPSNSAGTSSLWTCPPPAIVSSIFACRSPTP
jgi:predicted MPP superfamily phosphohydrolase